MARCPPNARRLAAWAKARNSEAQLRCCDQRLCPPYELKRSEIRMKRSADRILTTHVGSLPRPPELIALVRAKLRGEPVDLDAYARVLKRSVNEIVRKQVALGVDVIDDGECGKPSFVSYGNERLGGCT